MTDDQIDAHLDAILRASGSALKHFTLAKPKDDMRAALRVALAAPEAAEPVAWCALSIDGKHIAYFDGKPMVMPGRMGNDCHPVPLYAGLAHTDSQAGRDAVEAEPVTVTDEMILAACKAGHWRVRAESIRDVRAALVAALSIATGRAAE